MGNGKMPLTLKDLEELYAAGIGFLVGVRRPGGSETLGLNPEGVLSFLKDPIELAADCFGASKEDYLAWVETDGNPRCSATTRSGKRCSNGCGGGMQKDFAEWKALDGGYCKTHGGPGYENLHGK